MTAKALKLQLHDPPGIPTDGLGRALQARRRLVEADRRHDGALDVSQAVEVVRCQGLLDHQQVVFVQLAEHVDVAGSIGSAGVDHQRDVPEMLADGADSSMSWPGRISIFTR